jgi:hypothetical protein
MIEEGTKVRLTFFACSVAHKEHLLHRQIQLLRDSGDLGAATGAIDALESSTQPSLFKKAEELLRSQHEAHRYLGQLIFDSINHPSGFETREKMRRMIHGKL